MDVPLYATASTFAGDVDQIGVVMLTLFSAIAAAICVVIVFLAVKYHRSNRVDRSNPPDHSLLLEISWTAAAIVIVMGFFTAGSLVYVREGKAPENPLTVYITGKQWMWKAYYPDGQQEINGLHIPVGRPVKLVMTSQDVIHSFYVPAFRVKADVLPGRYSSMWFEATQTGTFHLFCAEYCGNKHSEMIGHVTAMEPTQFQDWMSGRGGHVPLAQAGAQLYQKLGCVACHTAQAAAGTQRGPKLEGMYGKPVKLTDGRMVVADDNYIRESILQPRAKVVASFEPIMPSYEGQVTPEELTELLAYVKSLAESSGK